MMMASGNKRLILVAFPMVAEGDLDRIRAVGGGLEVVFAPFMEDDATRWAVRRTLTTEEIRSRRQDLPEVLVDRLPDAEILLTLDAPARLDERAPKLRWIHNIGSGTEHFRGSGAFEAGIVVTNSKGLAAPAMAEFVMAQLLALAKQLPERLRLQQ